MGPICGSLRRESGLPFGPEPKPPTPGLTMSRNANPTLEGLDPEVLEAAREVAHRAGVPVESWIASVVEGATESVPAKAAAGTKATPRKRARSTVPPNQHLAARVPATRERAAPKPAVAPTPASATSDEAVADAVGTSIAEMMRRLDALDRTIAEQRQASSQAAAEAIGALEKRVSELGEEIGRPRALGRRGQPLLSEVRSAVEEVRKRQRELDASAAPAPAPVPGAPSPAISALREETGKLRDSIGTLATGRDVGALEQAMRALASDIQRAREPADLAAISAPIELMRVQVGRLADEVAENVHARLSSEVERLADKVDRLATGAPANFAERDALDGLFTELDEIRRLLGGLAGPERIQGLTHGLQAISDQIAQLQVRAADAGVAELKPLLEEIRSGMDRPGETELLHRIEALAERMGEQQASNPVGEIVGRLDHLGEALRRSQAPQQGQLSSIHGMLHDLAEKIDRLESGGNANLDALESQVVALAQRLDSRGGDPALSTIERTMGDLIAQVSALRDGGAVEAALERAARKAVAEALQSGHEGAGSEALRADLADLRARQNAADARLFATMDNVNTALERLLARLGSDTPAAPQPSAPKPAPRASAADEGAAKAKRPERPRIPTEIGHLGDELLEPGAARPQPGRNAAAASAGAPSGGDIKTSFIAAARRAAQAAQADIAAEVGAPGRNREAGAGKTPGRADAASPAMPAGDNGRTAAFRAEISKRRRPLLLGLAAIVLVLGALQAWTVTMGEPEAPAQTPVAASAPPEGPAATAATAPAQNAPDRPANPDPTTTQSIAPAEDRAAKPVASEAKPEAGDPAPSNKGRSAVPRVTTVAALAPDLAGIPPASPG
ncbi:hypothetical protein LKMONMHP_2723 [Methylobacterium organophilum]|uniref:Peptidoglycan-binding protein n=2 Tax=Methylobacterium organophilum TaxID=410 RepID=A0ABQ4TBW9_METOR|nr:hypothetical protein LKMONMHP_2723 [Methylobacterium organophilum]